MSSDNMGRVIVDGLKYRIEHLNDTEELQKIINELIPMLEEKFPDNYDVGNLERLAEERIRELDRRRYS